MKLLKLKYVSHKILARDFILSLSFVFLSHTFVCIFRSYIWNAEKPGSSLTGQTDGQLIGKYVQFQIYREIESE